MNINNFFFFILFQMYKFISGYKYNNYKYFIDALNYKKNNASYTSGIKASLLGGISSYNIPCLKDTSILNSSIQDNIAEKKISVISNLNQFVADHPIGTCVLTFIGFLIVGLGAAYMAVYFKGPSFDDSASSISSFSSIGSSIDGSVASISSSSSIAPSFDGTVAIIPSSSSIMPSIDGTVTNILSSSSIIPSSDGSVVRFLSNSNIEPSSFFASGVTLN